MEDGGGEPAGGFEQVPVAAYFGTRQIFAGVICGERRLTHDLPRQTERVDRNLPVLVGRQIIGRNQGLDGRRLQTLAVKAPKGWRPSPHLSSDSG